MLSNPTTNLQQRQRQHRRQLSTPTAFEAPKVPSLPNIQRHASHRRGMSLDQRQRRQPIQQENKRVSTTNNGFQQIQQHILRETQQQRLARPGQPQQQQTPPQSQTNDENYLISPLISPQASEFDVACLTIYRDSREQMPLFTSYPDHPNTIVKMEHDVSPRSTQFRKSESPLFPQDGLPSPYTSPYIDFSVGLDDGSLPQDWGTIKASSKPSPSRRVSGGIADRVAMYEDMGAGNPSSRPITPPTQNALSYFPPTPAATPFSRDLESEPVPQRFLDSYDISMEDTIKPLRSKSNQRTSVIFQEMREQAELNQPSTSPNLTQVSAFGDFDSAPIPTSDFMSMSNINLDFLKTDPGYESSQYSPTASNLSPGMSQHSSPEIPHAQLFGNPFESKPNLEASQSHSSPSRDTTHQNLGYSSRASSPHRRSMTIDGVDLAETITETGITIDDIACYIDGPDAADQKWSCLFPECRKRFGRKENIKSHVQTHLGDRQYQCPHCKKCFVRQHDLKRHAKIHSGVKPYPCACGNSFARHDALTRHRQRGMCIGAFEGIVKKVVKRGRPRKNRPDAEERHDKASRTRSKNKAMSSASSTSGYSESSYGLSPPADFDILDEKPFGDFTNDFSQTMQFSNNDNFQYPTAQSPMPNDYVSPQAILNAPSPSSFSTHSQNSHYSYHTSRGSIDETGNQHLPPLPPSPTKSVTSHYNTPPELCLSSSSPAPSHQIYDFAEPSESGDLDFSKLGALQDIHIPEHNDEMFLDAFGNAGDMSSTRLEQDPNLLLMGGKFDDTFGDWDNWARS